MKMTPSISHLIAGALYNILLNHCLAEKNLGQGEIRLK